MLCYVHFFDSMLLFHSIIHVFLRFMVCTCTNIVCVPHMTNIVCVPHSHLYQQYTLLHIAEPSFEMVLFSHWIQSVWLMFAFVLSAVHSFAHCRAFV